MNEYTHFTSPIRRYADCVVHRFLSAAQGFEELPAVLREDKARWEAKELVLCLSGVHPAGDRRSLIVVRI